MERLIKEANKLSKKTIDYSNQMHERWCWKYNKKEKNDSYVFRSNIAQKMSAHFYDFKKQKLV